VCKVLSIATMAGSVRAEQHFKEMSLRFDTVGSVARRGIELNPPRICSPGVQSSGFLLFRVQGVWYRVLGFQGFALG
jgi:hypothetical protein